jgi:hypothetical protein
VSISTEAPTARAARGWQAVLVVGLGVAASGYGVQLISHLMTGSGTICSSPGDGGGDHSGCVRRMLRDLQKESARALIGKVSCRRWRCGPAPIDAPCVVAGAPPGRAGLL